MCESAPGVLAVIPARWASTRFPGKPLAPIAGEPMVQHVYRAALQAVGRAVVATDDERILKAVRGFGGEAVMTSPGCPNGTARVAEAVKALGIKPRIVLNVQGDEPDIAPGQLRSVVQALESSPDAQVATLALRYNPAWGYRRLSDPNRVKLTLTCGTLPRVLSFSRSVIPFVRDCLRREWPSATQYYMHIGVYAFRGDVLQRLAALEPTPLDRAENLEQLRWMAHGLAVVAAITDTPTHAVDTPVDLAAFTSTITRI